MARTRSWARLGTILTLMAGQVMVVVVAASGDDVTTGLTVRLSTTSDGTGGSALGVGTMSDDGRVAVVASGEDLIAGDENGNDQDGENPHESQGSYLVDTDSGAITRLNRYVPYYSLSGDGSLGAFAYTDTPVALGVPFDDPGGPGVFVQETATRSFRRVATGDAVNGSTGGPLLSEDGSTVAYIGYSGDSFAGAALYTVGSAGGAPQLVHTYPSGYSRFYFDLSADGQEVVFQTSDESIDPSYSNGVDDIFIKHMSSGSTEIVSIDADRTNRSVFSQYPFISGDGKKVFWQSAGNFVGHGVIGSDRIWRKDLDTNKVTMVSRGADGRGVWAHLRAVSSDGDVIAFDNLETDADVTLLRSMSDGAIEAIVKGAQVDGPDLSSDGAQVLFTTQKAVVTGDTNGTWDVFLKGGTFSCETDECALVVDSIEDTPDKDRTDASCADDDGACTLRAAIQEANARPGADAITFDIPETTPLIRVRSPLPELSDAVTIDGSTQPGFSGLPLVDLDGRLAGAGVVGLDIHSSETTIRGLSVIGFDSHGIRIRGDHNVLAGNLVGLSSERGLIKNAGDGVRIVAGDANIVGGAPEAEGNTIGGSGGDGIQVGATTSGTMIVGNEIGVASGQAIGNSGSGVRVSGPSTTIGGASALLPDGPCSGLCNIISGNDGGGILIVGEKATAVTVSGNAIGTDIEGRSEMPNEGGGVLISDATGNLIGGMDIHEGNLISGNNEVGVSIEGQTSRMNTIANNFIGTAIGGTEELGNPVGVRAMQARNNTIGPDNLISGNNGPGISIRGPDASTNKILGNDIGTYIAAGGPLANLGHGVSLRDAPDTIIGGTTAEERNVISGNAGSGVRIEGSPETKVKGNLIGVYVGQESSDEYLGNRRDGVSVFGSPRTVIGGSTGLSLGGACSGACNVISGNEVGGSYVVDSPQTRLLGNYIGTDDAGSDFIPNKLYGIKFGGDTSRSTIGSMVPGRGNVVSGNGQVQISINDEKVKVFGNRVGTNAAGDVDAPCPIAETEEPACSIGILVRQDGNEIGGPGHGNLISGLVFAAIKVISDGNSIQSNVIGPALDGETIVGNDSEGILFAASANDNFVGGYSPELMNVIAGNEKAIVMEGEKRAGGQRNTVARNSFFSNTVSSIDLADDGPTANDPLDADLGPNRFQNFPTLVATGTETFEVDIDVTGEPGSTSRVLIYAAPACHSSGRGEGKTYVGTARIELDDEGEGDAEVSFDRPLVGAFVLTATSTDQRGNTSEFSPCAAVG
jgi:trimeric autotransporter adhesin